MSAPPSIDDLWAAFVAALPEAQGATASGLAVTLGLAPTPAVPWSEVFSNEITLGAPGLVAEAMPALPDPIVKDAAFAHLCAIVEAFATDRLEDGQAQPSEALSTLLAQVRRARDEALARVAPAAADLSYAGAEHETMAAIHAEQAVLRGGEPVPWARYLMISYGKQRVGLPASLALARAAGWDARRTRGLGRMLDAVWVGLQLHDDVLDWQDDFARGGAWAVSMAAACPPIVASSDRETVPVSMPRLVFQSAVLARMLRASARCFRAARRRAELLGAVRLARWARDREATVGELAAREAESPGFTNRAHALSTWAKTVLA